MAPSKKNLFGIYLLISCLFCLPFKGDCFAHQKTPRALMYDFDNDNSSKIKYFLEPSIKGTWLCYPIWITAANTSDERLGQKGKSQKIEWNNKGMNCRWSVKLYPVNPNKYNSITFWVKGRDGKENFDIELSDDQIYKYRLEPLNIGSINSFLKNGVTKEWQKVKIPLSLLEGQINLTSINMMGLLFKYKISSESNAVFIDEITFDSDPDIDFQEQFNMPKSDSGPSPPRAVWVWKIDPVSDVWARKKLFDLCFNAGIKSCFIYFGDFSESNLTYITKLKDFLAESHERGIKIHTLGSNPIWALQTFHNEAIDWIKPFLEYNKKQKPEHRFDGCAFDVEPYLNTEWQKFPEIIKEDYINLLRKMRIFIYGYNDPEFKIGIPVPFFYKDEGGFEEKILKYVDYAVVMAYYDTSKKIIEVSQHHVSLATKMGKKMYIGVETEDLLSTGKGRRQNTFFEEGWENMEKVIEEVRKHFSGENGFAGFAMHHYTSYKNMTKGKNVPTKERTLPKDLNQFQVNYTKKEIIIDGSLDDWDISNQISLDNINQVAYYGRAVWRGANDYSLKACALWDESNLYFSFDVTDDKIVQDKVSQDIWEGDHIEFWIDSNLIDDYNDAVNTNDDFQFGFSPGNFQLLPAETYLFAPEQDNKDYLKYVEIASKQKNNGYIIEVKINIKMFKDIFEESLFSDNYENRGKLKFKEGMMFGFMIDGSDTDDLSMPQKLLMSSSKDRIWGDPTTFGIINLKNPESMFLEPDGAVEQETTGAQTLDKTKRQHKSAFPLTGNSTANDKQDNNQNAVIIRKYYLSVSLMLIFFLFVSGCLYYILKLKKH